MDTQTAKNRAHPVDSQPERTDLKECSICKGELVLDSFGTAVICDECWHRKCFLAVGED